MKSPTMLYKHPGSHEIHGDRFDYIIVDEDEVNQALADGWALTTDGAKHKNQRDEVKVESVNDGSPTRDEMIQKAENLGIKIDKRWSDETLLDKIDQALKGE